MSLPRLIRGEIYNSRAVRPPQFCQELRVFFWDACVRVGSASILISPTDRDALVFRNLVN